MGCQNHLFGGPRGLGGFGVSIGGVGSLRELDIFSYYLEEYVISSPVDRQVIACGFGEVSRFVLWSRMVGVFLPEV